MQVVRAGLTPKFKDVDVLLEMLIYEGATATEKLFDPEIYDDNHKHTLIYKPDVKDFAVAKISVSNFEISIFLKYLNETVSGTVKYWKL